MKIRIATKKDIIASLKIAEDLNEWFPKVAIKNMKLDFLLNNVVVAVNGKEIIGFLCYSSYEGLMKGLWAGVIRCKHGRGVGTKLFKWLIKETKKLGLRGIEIMTLTDKDNYKPYKATREFYYKLGFRKVGYAKARVRGWDEQVIMELKV